MGEQCDLTQTDDFLNLLIRRDMTLHFQSGFEIAKFSDLDYEGMTVEIRFNGIPVAQVNRDNGRDTQEIVIPSRFSPEGQIFVFPLTDFMEALEQAKELLTTLE